MEGQTSKRQNAPQQRLKTHALSILAKVDAETTPAFKN